jgi:hypothetical protein
VDTILNLPGLTRLHIHSGGDSTAARDVLLGLQRLPSLTDLLIPYPNIVDEGSSGYFAVIHLAMVAPQLRYVSLRDLDGIDDTPIIASLCTSLPSLIQLNLSNQDPVAPTRDDGIALTYNGYSLPRPLFSEVHRFQAVRICAPAFSWMAGEASILPWLGHLLSFELLVHRPDLTAQFLDAAAQVADGIPLQRLVVHLDVSGDVDVAPLRRLLTPICTPHLQSAEVHVSGGPLDHGCCDRPLVRSWILA